MILRFRKEGLKKATLSAPAITGKAVMVAFTFQQSTITNISLENLAMSKMIPMP
jgi:hypothetical protein